MLRFLTAGESHGPELTVILEGMPAGLSLSASHVDADLARRRSGAGSGGRMAIERDVVRISAGVMAGRTTGGPICITVVNDDYPNWRERRITPMTIPRPGHADLCAAVKYGYTDLRRALERSSARETAARVAMAAVCRRLLGEFGIIVGSYVRAIGEVTAEVPETPDYEALFAEAEDSPVRCPDDAATGRMIEEIDRARGAGDTLGGVLECVALHLPPGLGSHVHWDRRLTSRLLAAVGSIPAIKGVQIGRAFEHASRRGTLVHDEIGVAADGRLTRSSNRAGGLEGGITTGLPLVVQAAMKPISTTLRGLGSVDLATGRKAETVYERSDVCAVPRACVVVEAMVAFVLADALAEKLGGDSLSEMKQRFANLPQCRLEEFHMDNIPWMFGYDATSEE